jgi:DNA replicative helicase MCM subunit Mcm2 (Cdc46/Mcm family)
MKEVKKDLQALTRQLKALVRDTERLAKKLDKLQKAQAAKKPKVKRRARPAKKKVTKKRAPQLSASQSVLNIIKRSSKGVDTATLRKKTGFQGRKVRDILYRLKKQRKIRSPRKGFYIKTARA